MKSDKSLAMAMAIRRQTSKRRTSPAQAKAAEQEHQSEKSIPAAIIAKRRKYEEPENSEADLAADNIDKPSELDELNEKAAEDGLYDIDEAIEPQPEDSNLIGNKNKRLMDRLRQRVHQRIKGLRG